MIEVSSGITITGIRPRAQVGTRQLAIQWAISPASTPPTMAPRNPVAGSAVAVGAGHVEQVGGQAAHDEAGGDARTVGDRVGDVAGEAPG